MGALRVVLADDHPIWRDGLRADLAGSFEVVAEAGTADDAIAVGIDVRQLAQAFDNASGPSSARIDMLLTELMGCASQRIPRLGLFAKLFWGRGTDLVVG